MNSFAFRALTPTLAVATILGLLAGPAAVWARNPYYRAAVATPSPYWGYGWNPYYDGGLFGAAAVINAQGEFLKQVEEARILHERVRRERIETHKAELEHWEYVRDFYAKIFPRQEERNLQAEYTRSMSLAVTTGEILNAKFHNRLINELKSMRDLPADGSTPIPDDVLSHINPTVLGRGNAGLLKLERLAWPMLLRQPDYKSDREEVGKLMAKARELIISNQGQSDELYQVVRELRGLAQKLGMRLKQLVQSPVYQLDWSENDYGDATRFLLQLQGAVKILGTTQASFYLTPLEGKTVAELVQYMKDKGVEIAPATEGSERYYKILYTKLVEEMRRLRPNLSTTDRP